MSSAALDAGGGASPGGATGLLSSCDVGAGVSSAAGVGVGANAGVGVADDGAALACARKALDCSSSCFSFTCRAALFSARAASLSCCL